MLTKKNAAIYGIITLSLLLMPISVLAQVGTVQTGLSGFANFANIYDFLRFIVRVLLSVAAIIAVIFLVIGGIRYVASAGNADAVEAAKSTILYAVIGLVIIILAWFIVLATTNLIGTKTKNDPATNPNNPILVP